MPDALTLLETRRTIAAMSLAEPGPSEDEIRTIIRIAARVPDHGKLTPWRFVLYRGAAREALDERLYPMFLAKFPDMPEMKREQQKTRFSGVPLTIAVISRAAPHVKIPEWEQVLSVGASAMNLVLAAHALGYAAQWLTEWFAYDAAASSILGVKEGERLAGLISIGTPTVEPVDRPRPDYAAIVTEWEA
jgi:nitroreductase